MEPSRGNYTARIGFDVMKIRSKFTVDFKTLYPENVVRVHLQAAYPSPSEINNVNTSLWKATPSGAIDMTLTNPDAADFFIVGRSYYLDFSEISPA